MKKNKTKKSLPFLKFINSFVRKVKSFIFIFKIFYAWLFFSSKILRFSEIEFGMQTKLGKNRLICFQRGRTNVSIKYKI